MNSQLAKRYDPVQIENKWYRRWQEQRLFGACADSDEPSYSIVLPPPNVTGTLHMGHAFQTSLIDTLIRYQKMRGKNVLWQGGVDHAGIATQMVVERVLESESLTRQELGREEFVKRIWQWKDQSGGTINRQLKRLGCSIDWSRDRFTMDEPASQAVSRAFCDLYHDGLIYRGHKLTNWDIKLQTVVSDLEVVYTEEPGRLYHIRYPVAGSDSSVVVATTRPETLFGDSAVAVHPHDERYASLIGARVVVPLAQREIPIIADEGVDMAFGTGCLKITPAHDFNDFDIGQRHGLDAISVMDEHGRLNENAPAPFCGLPREQARAEVVRALEQSGLLESAEDYKQRIPRGDRSNEILEPRLTSQWFVDTTGARVGSGGADGKKILVQPAIDAVRRGDIRFVPKHWENTYFHWMENLHDWCISRQIWWGHRIPAWYSDDGEIYVAENIEQVYSRYGLDPATKLRQDNDVLDTWFSSALWPFSSLDWPQSPAMMKAYYPTSVLVTGFDIIFFWVARMIMFGLHFHKQPPFRDIYIHGLIRDTRNQKMSKSRGNVIDPLDLIDGIGLDDLVAKRTSHMMQPRLRAQTEKQTRQEFPDGIDAYGCDSIRFAFNALASTGRDIRLDMKRVEGSRNFCNKLWNAGRYLLMQSQTNPLAFAARAQVEKAVANAEPTLSTFQHPCNRWIVSELQSLSVRVHRHINDYRFDLNARALYEFVWESYCDWYLEFSKFLLDEKQGGNSVEVQKETLVCLYGVFESLLRLLHPVIPFISEEIHEQLFPARPGCLSQLRCPEGDNALVDDESEKLLVLIRGVVGTIRQARSVRGIAPGQPVPLMFYHPPPGPPPGLLEHQALVCYMAKVSSIELVSEPRPKQASSLHFFDDLHILVPMQSADEIAQELNRLERELAGTGKRLDSVQRRLDNPGYVAKAPADVIARDRADLVQLRVQREQTSAQIAHVSTLSSA